MNEMEFDACTIKFEVFDANAIRRNVLIGCATVDLKQVYVADHHELYK